MTDSKEVKIIGAGSPVVDLLAYVEDSFLKENISGDKGGMELVEADEIKRITDHLDKIEIKAPGGSAGNTIFALCELGANGAMLGKTGTDEDGEFYRSSLVKAGGDDSTFRKDNDSPTAVSICMVTPDAERTMRTHLGAAMKFAPEDVTIDDFKGFPYFHIEGYLIFNQDLITHLLKTAKEAGCKISLDLASFEVVNASKGFLPELLKKYVDIIFANEDEAEAFCSTADPEKAVSMLSEYCEISVVKLGKKGSLIKSGNEIIKIEPELCENPVDTTGAGDYWAAGFLYGLLNKSSLENCGKLGSMLGKEIVSILGAELPKETWDKLRDYSKNIIG